MNGGALDLTIADVEDAILQGNEEQLAIMQDVMLSFYMPMIEQMAALQAAGLLPAGMPPPPPMGQGE